MDAIKRIELRFGSIQKPHAAGIAGIINQVMKPIGPQRRQRLLKGADKPVKGVGFAGAEGQRDRPRALSFNPRDLASGVLTEVLADFRPAPCRSPCSTPAAGSSLPGYRFLSTG